MSPTNKDRIKIGLVGAGRIAQAHLQALGQVPEFDLKGVADTRENAAQSVAEQFHCKAHPDHRRLADVHDLDAVIACSPPQ